MAKSKNHTNHNQSVKDHKNGIKKAAPKWKFMALRGSWMPALINARRVRRNNQTKIVEARKERLAEFRKTLGKK